MKNLIKIISLTSMVFLSGCTINLTNDIFSGTDEDFTHGTEFRYQKPIEESNSTLRSIAEALPDIPLSDQKEPTHVSARIGQHIYTPDDLRSEEVIKEDNPYAGWLFGEVKRQVLTEDEKKEVGITIGLIGKYSFAEHAQKFVHNDLGKGTDPRGWDNQLDHEPGLILSAGREKVFHRFSPGGLEADIRHGADVRLGNIHTDLRYGPELRFGKGLPDFNGYEEKWSAYGYVGSNLRVVGRNIFYDGNTFTDSHSVGAEPIVGELTAGGVTQIYGWEVGLHYKYTSPEHEQRDSGHSIWYLNISRALDLFD